MSELNVTPSTSSTPPTRRQFIQKTSAAVAGTALISEAMSTAVYAAGKDVIKVGVVGCGGRGGGAVVNAMHADDGARLVAMGDLFMDAAQTKLKQLKLSDAAEQIDPKVELFSGWDAYKHVIEASDVVILTTTPHFRPMMLKACIEAGKHIFCEKPVGVDAKSVKEVMDLSNAAAQKHLNLVSGLCYRYDKYCNATMEQIHSGRIGDIVAINSNYLTGWLWNKPRKPEWSDMEYQIRNWLYYYWLSGDHVVEQHIHSLDKALWTMGNVPPTRVTSSGGRQQRTAPEFGNVYDHFGNVFEWDQGQGHIVRCFSYCRQYTGQPVVATDVSDWVMGTEGVANLDQHKITGKNPWKKGATSPENMYDTEHKVLFGAIRSGKAINNGDYMCKSTLMAIIARESAYSGRTITWDEILASKQDLSPSMGWQWTKVPVAPVAVPNIYKFE